MSGTWTSGAGLSGLVDCAEAGHDFGCAFQRSGREGADAVNFDLVAVAESGGERDHRAGRGRIRRR